MKYTGCASEKKKEARKNAKKNLKTNKQTNKGLAFCACYQTVEPTSWHMPTNFVLKIRTSFHLLNILMSVFNHWNCIK